MLLEGFRVMEDSSNGDKLIVPDFNTGNKGWNQSNKWMRSLHIDKYNNIISVGFPKFLNLNEGDEKCSLRVTSNDLFLSKEVVCTSKIDGSLIIRYVRDGKVYFRTRGSFGVGIDSWEKDVEKFKDAYPLLFDPKWFSWSSFLMEYVTPDNQIVIKYDRPDLIAIGAVLYEKNMQYCGSKINLASMACVKTLARGIGMSCADFFYLKSFDDVTAILEKTSNTINDEGFVLRLGSGDRMVKVKTDWYIKLHALKSNLDTAHMIDIMFNSGETTYVGFAEYFQRQFDFETYQYCIPIISSMFDGFAEWQKQYFHIKSFVDKNRHMQRKEFADLAKNRFRDYNLAIVFMILDGKNLPNDLVKKMILQKCKHISKKMFD